MFQDEGGSEAVGCGRPWQVIVVGKMCLFLVIVLSPVYLVFK